MNLQETVQVLKSRFRHSPEIGLVLGTGLNNLAELVEDADVLPYAEIPGFVPSTAPSHQGRLICGMLDGKAVLIQQGRLHYYEGVGMQQVTYPIRVMKALGIHTVILTNASGSLKKEFSPGSIICIEDHINLFGTNPLIGPNDDSQGERFPSMHDAYCSRLRQILHNVAGSAGISIHDGVYAGVSGPTLETRAECRMMATLGADVVGMSTVPETITAVHAGIAVLGISVVTNYGNIIKDDAHSQEEIRRHAGLAFDRMKTLIMGVVGKIDSY